MSLPLTKDEGESRRDTFDKDETNFNSGHQRPGVNCKVWSQILTVDWRASTAVFMAYIF